MINTRHFLRRAKALALARNLTLAGFFPSVQPGKTWTLRLGDESPSIIHIPFSGWNVVWPEKSNPMKIT